MVLGAQGSEERDLDPGDEDDQGESLGESTFSNNVKVC